MRELESNVSLRVQDTDEAGVYEVAGRGTLHLGILVENMRREGYEFAVGKPRVIFEDVDGERHEPIEFLICQVPEEFSGRVIEALGSRRAEMTKFEPQGERVQLEFTIPSRQIDCVFTTRRRFFARSPALSRSHKNMFLYYCPRFSGITQQSQLAQLPFLLQAVPTASLVFPPLGTARRNPQLKIKVRSSSRYLLRAGHNGLDV